MLRYLNAAFWATIDFERIGRLPVNLLALIGFGILGFGNPGFWLLGLGLEVAFLWGLSTNKRFQRVVDAAIAAKKTPEEVDHLMQMRRLIAKIHPDERIKLGQVQKKAERALRIHAESGIDDFFIDSNRHALDRLIWLYLKLLVARHYLNLNPNPAREEDLRRQLKSLLEELDSKNISGVLRSSKQATADIVKQRLQNTQRRGLALEEIESDLTRIDAQLDLAIENAAIRSRGAILTGNIDLATRLLDHSVFGEDRSAIDELDEAYQARDAAKSMAQDIEREGELLQEPEEPGSTTTSGQAVTQ